VAAKKTAHNFRGYLFATPGSLLDKNTLNKTLQHTDLVSIFITNSALIIQGYKIQILTTD